MRPLSGARSWQPCKPYNTGYPRPRPLDLQAICTRAFELTDQTWESLIAWLTHRGGGLRDYVFPSRTDGTDHISTRKYARLVGDWVESIGLGRLAYGTHSLRRTKVALIYKRTGNLRAVQILLGHTKLESTVRYLGVDAEDALTLSEATEV